MFKLLKNNRVYWPVTIHQPADGGTTTQHKCQVEFEIKEQDIFNQLANEGDQTLLTNLVTGWRGIGDENGDEMEYNQENLTALINIPFVRTGLIRGYMEAASGAPAKN